MRKANGKKKRVLGATATSLENKHVRAGDYMEREHAGEIIWESLLI